MVEERHFKLDASVQSRMNARTEEREAKRADADLLKDPKEDQFKFYSEFTAAVGSIKAMIAAAEQGKADGEEPPALEERFAKISVDMSALSTLAVEGSQHLPPYDQRQNQISLRELEQAAKSLNGSSRCVRRWWTPEQRAYLPPSSPSSQSARPRQRSHPNRWQWTIRPARSRWALSNKV